MEDEAEEESTLTQYSNQILGFLLGYTPKLDVKPQHNSGWEEAHNNEKMVPKVNSRDAKLHFLMGRYNSHAGMFAHDDLAHEIRHRMALDTAFFSLFPDYYAMD